MPGTRDAVSAGMMTRWIALPFVLLTACVCGGQEYVGHRLANSTVLGPELAACTTTHDCEPLCRELFALDDNDDIESCKVGALDSSGDAQVTVRYANNAVCGTGGLIDAATGVVISTGDGSTGDGSTDDGSTDDGSTDDGSTDDGSDNGSDSGSDDGSDSGSDAGSDSGSDDGTDGTYRTAPHHTRASARSTIAISSSSLNGLVR
jgi:hypothetical protein